MSGTDWSLLLLTLAVTLALYVRKPSRPPLPYPPGPKKLPLLGNLFDLPFHYGWKTYARWGRELNSDIVHLHVAGRDIIVLNSLKAAIDLLDKKSLIYSSRPRFTMMTDLMGWDWTFSTMAYGESWRQRRRLFLQYFNKSNAYTYQAQQVKFVHTALLRLLDQPNNFFGVIEDMGGGMALSLAYGLKIQDVDDPFVGLCKRAFQTALDAALPGAFMVDVIPWLKHMPSWVPGAGFQKKAKSWRRLQEDFRNLPYEEAVQQLATGSARPSLTSYGLEKLCSGLNVGPQTEIVKDTAGMVFAGATDTTFSAITTFVAAMLSFPEVQKTAQNELDRVLGGKLPTFEDEPQLPYISALVKELLRWMPVTPLGLPHQLTEDDVYAGYHIPKGALVLANSWAMLHDEKDYPEPSSFKPERFLTEYGHLNEAVRDPSSMAFGFGRRICPGARVATSLLWIWVASFLATYIISDALDENGLPIAQSIEYQSASVTFHPLPFNCLIKPRSNATEELIRSQNGPD